MNRHRLLRESWVNEETVVPDNPGVPGVADGQAQLCFGGPEDLDKDIWGSIQFGPLPSGDPFPEERMEDFPYASKLHCPRYNQSLHLVPDACRLEPFEPQLFLEQFKGRRLIFWGDSVMRQHFAYLVLRLEGYQTRAGFDIAGNSKELPLADPDRCKVRSRPDSMGLQLSKACFHIQSNAFESHESCFYYLDGTTALCYVKNSVAMVDEKNVVFWNELRESDIVLANIGIHHNRRSGLRNALSTFARFLHYHSLKQQLPLMIWRETSAQHFDGGEGGNYPPHHSHLRDVDPRTFNCTEHPHQMMQATDWRNRYVHELGFTAENLEVKFPILRVWNTTSMAHWLHPRTHGTKTEHAVADCTHFCPSYGGIYEVWSTLLQNFLVAAQPLEVNLRPKISTGHLNYHKYSRTAVTYADKEIRFVMDQL
eukprot:CAMPEP_0117675108 /NCGR_PEP_ID=MMETSP0804-20121206/15423_1 /TAXON_ID=1074897 /ORGANISM="Tetraselmis astigmatica, Strain CCMP880" /LENGTH=423 /DNA_ID=CAMNT_0005484077 /DNA_START=386 /DNA_END=1657 /DNA_ORIENTATION=-